MLSASTDNEPSLITERSHANVQLAVQALLDDQLILYTTFPWSFPSMGDHKPDAKDAIRGDSQVKITRYTYYTSNKLNNFIPNDFPFSINQVDIIEYSLLGECTQVELELSKNKPHRDRCETKLQQIVVLGTTKGAVGTRLWTPKNAVDPSDHFTAFDKILPQNGADLPQIIQALENASNILEVAPGLGVAFRAYSINSQNNLPSAIHSSPLKLAEGRTVYRLWITHPDTPDK